MDASYSAFNKWNEQMNNISRAVDMSGLRMWKEQMDAISKAVDMSGITSGITRWQEQINAISKTVDMSGITSGITRWKEQMDAISKAADMSGITLGLMRWQEQMNNIYKAVDMSGISIFQEQITGVLNSIEMPVINWHNRFYGLTKSIEISKLTEWQDAFGKFIDVQNIITEHGYSIDNFEIDDYNNNDEPDKGLICNTEALSKEETTELEEDINEIVDRAFNYSSSRRLNIYDEINKKYLKWETKNSFKAWIFKIVIAVIIENIVIFLWGVFVSNVKTLVPLIVHEESNAKSEVVCTVPADSAVKLYPLQIPYYYYIMYTDPITGDIYDGCVYKGKTKFEKIEAIDEITLPAALY